MNKFKLTENAENKMATIISGHNKADLIGGRFKKLIRRETS
jgi:hypothetical protein